MYGPYRIFLQSLFTFVSFVRCSTWWQVENATWGKDFLIWLHLPCNIVHLSPEITRTPKLFLSVPERNSDSHWLRGSWFITFWFWGPGLQQLEIWIASQKIHHNFFYSVTSGLIKSSSEPESFPTALCNWGCPNKRYYFLKTLIQMAKHQQTGWLCKSCHKIIQLEKPELGHTGEWSEIHTPPLEHQEWRIHSKNRRD